MIDCKHVVLRFVGGDKEVKYRIMVQRPGYLPSMELWEKDRVVASVTNSG